MVQIVINIEKRHLWVFAILIVLFAGVGYVVGFGTSDPQTFGHTASEIQGATTEAELNLGYDNFFGAIDISNNAIISNDDGGDGSQISVVRIKDTQTSGGTNALYTEGPLTVYPRGGDPDTESTSVYIGKWELRAVAQDDILCVDWGTTNIGYFDRYTATWVEETHAACQMPPP